MLIRELGCDPDDGDGFKAGGVGQQLAEVTVIRAFQLILNQNPAVGRDVLAEDVRPKRTHRTLLGFQLKVDTQRFAKHGEILGTGQPGGEFCGLTRPDVSQLDRLKATEGFPRHNLFSYRKDPRCLFIQRLSKSKESISMYRNRSFGT